MGRRGARLQRDFKRDLVSREPERWERNEGSLKVGTTAQTPGRPQEEGALPRGLLSTGAADRGRLSMRQGLTEHHGFKDVLGCSF